MESQQEAMVNDVWSRYLKLPSDQRLLVSIGGAPGSGKTTLANHLVTSLNGISKRSSPSTQPPALAVSMDGYHFYRSQLDKFSDPVEAHRRRGSPFTFDLDRYAELVKKLRGSISNGEDILAPSFDHALKDPVENAVRIGSEHKIVLVEGNYVALSKGKWGDVAKMFDVVIFVEVDEKTAGNRLAKRHVAAGIVKTLEEGWERARTNDLINGREVAANIVGGDNVVVHIVKSVTDEDWAKVQN